MLRGILISLLLIGLAVYSLDGGTMALFTDTETASGTFAVGTMDFRYRVSQDGGGTWGAWQNGTSALTGTFIVNGTQFAGQSQSGVIW
ncbi:MAG: SipW-dependent-type signal peptide-containing protein [Dehalococcoidia bacterium]|nr:SipW-dependent-type signal peptide-containing protein [Dehalococcoidia bacterium]